MLLAQCGSVPSKYSFPLIHKRWLFTQVIMSLVNLASALICFSTGPPGEGGRRSSKSSPSKGLPTLAGISQVLAKSFLRINICMESAGGVALGEL